MFEQTSTIKEFAEQTAVATRLMYAAPNRRTTHRLVRLDVPTPSWMRAPGECPGMFALESAMDELAEACGIDPIELRVRNEPDVDPETGQPFCSRHLVACLREGAARFGWAGRDPRPGVRRDGRWLIGTGVAASTYPARAMPSQARATVRRRPLRGAIAAADIGTGARTVLLAVAADALGVPGRHRRADRRQRAAARDDRRRLDGHRVLELGGDQGLPRSARPGRPGTGPCRRAGSARTPTRRPTSPPSRAGARYAFGAQFAEVRVDVDTGEIRVPRLLGVFAAGRIINPAQARRS